MTTTEATLAPIRGDCVWHGSDIARSTRLLLRVWLSMPNSRALPVSHAVLWRATDAGALRGGIGQEAVG